MSAFCKQPQQTGQAMVETLVASLALVPLLLVLPHIGKTLDVKAKALETSRYALWERFLYRETATSAASRTKSSAEIQSAASSRIHSEPGTRIQTVSQSQQADNSFWKDRNDESLLEDGGIQVSVSMAGDGLIRGLATEALFVGEWTGLSGLMNEFDVPQLDHNRKGKAVVATSYEISNLPELRHAGMSVEFGEAGSGEAATSFTDALVGYTGTWMPDSETEFNGKLDSLVMDKGLAIATDIGCLAGIDFAGLLKESQYCVENDLTSDSRVIPDRFLDTENKRGQTQ